MAKKSAPSEPESTRPKAPAAITESRFATIFAPSPELLEWAVAMFIRGDAPLHNPDHTHLLDARIGFLWASSGYAKQGRAVLGQTEDLRLASRGNGWQRARAEQQLADWFPDGAPDFLITLDAQYCQTCTESELCALVEHELYHIGHQLDEFGTPKFSRDTGEPKLAIRGHDVEEFIGVVRRYGAGEPDGAVSQLVQAASRGPEISGASIAKACGTCMARQMA